jgi:hypothetical protein
MKAEFIELCNAIKRKKEEKDLIIWTFTSKYVKALDLLPIDFTWENCRSDKLGFKAGNGKLFCRSGYMVYSSDNFPNDKWVDCTQEEWEDALESAIEKLYKEIQNEH